MLLHACPPSERHTLPLQAESDSHVSSERSTRFLWTGFGFVAIVLTGVCACALLPLASQASAKLAHPHAEVLHFAFASPVLLPGGPRARHHTARRSTTRKSVVPALRAQMTQLDDKGADSWLLMAQFADALSSDDASDWPGAAQTMAAITVPTVAEKKVGPVHEPVKEVMSTPVPRVFALSDLHTDYADNMKLLEAMPQRPDDVILLAGDISHDLDIVRKTFELFLSKFRFVFYCPGNHDLWITEKDSVSGKEDLSDSLQKLDRLLALCDSLGVITKPQSVGGGIFIVPMLSWYEPDFDKDPSISHPTLQRKPYERLMRDFRSCKWPAGLSASNASLSRLFDALNGQLPDTSGHNIVISFSHFLPRPDLLPEKRFLFYPPLAKAVGSLALGDRVRKLRPSAHVFGHTHHAWCAELDGTLFMQAAVAYPRERTRKAHILNLDEGGIEDRHGGNGVTAPVLVYDAPEGKLAQFDAFWSRYYAMHQRRPQDVQWLYRPPRERYAVDDTVAKLARSGQAITDKAIAQHLGEK